MNDLKDDVTAWLRRMIATADIPEEEVERYFAIGGDIIRDDGALVCEHGTYIVELRLAKDAEVRS